MKKKEAMNERIKKIRKTLDLTQQQLAKLLGIRTVAVTKIENGDTNLSKHNILLICTPNHLKDGKTININWLHTGEGDMFNPASAQSVMDEDGKPLNPDEGMFIRAYRKLSPANREVVKVVVDAMQKSQNKEAEKQAK
jgi:transcriptional regulator with XRE-family HTH domain